ncbi:efflux RND transporter periplasmic adaptor subunit [Herbaspirillum lusitanum]|uniref:efflux RND transporter periplasmic adaptor subunit n=1 Tax=Herbaspirillum lusitanum TaxID=213312 RepID=UPI0022373AA2|nr:efflux RND transporter periplasmic adaptor subunit [Herbaspirillum lusitanum]MCW5300219.1 efflux RND transporter periplasmic adaptor subunit [Herbaspirillum lusitanum]
MGINKKYMGMALSGALIATLAACSKPAPPPATAPRVASFTVQNVEHDSASYTGVVHARTESNLGFRVPGKIVERLVDPGELVKRGQALFKLDSTDYTLAQHAARSAVIAAQARDVQAQADEVRLRKLLNSGAVSRQAYEQSKALADSAKAQLDAERARAGQVENQSDYSVLRADADGVVMDVLADAGQVVGAGQTIVRLAQKGPREAVVSIPENGLGQARRQASATLYTDDTQKFAAKLRELSAMADPLTRTYQARYVLSGKGEQAPLGSTVTIRLTGDTTSTEQTEVPIGALIDKGHGASVWLIEKQTQVVKLVPVTVVRLGEEFAAISAGLKAGDVVVAYGTHLLKAGDKVSVVSPQSAAHTGGAS